MTYLDDVEKLAQLKQKKLISQEEYEIQKAQLMKTGGTAQPVDTKSQTAYCVLALFLGGFGVHNFYAGRIGCAIAQLLMVLFGWIAAGIPNFAAAVWATVEIFMVNKDGKGKPFQPSSTAKLVCGILSIIWTICVLFPLFAGYAIGFFQGFIEELDL